MNTLTKLLKQKKGMTLVETIIAFLIAGILIAGTGALIISGLNLFQDTAARNLDQQIGDNVLEIVRDQLQYAKTIEGINQSPVSEATIGTAGAIFVGGNEDGEDGVGYPLQQGQLYLKKPGDNESVFAVYPQDNFYSGRTLKLSLNVDKVNPKALTLTVQVMDGNDVKYKRSTSFELLNSGEYDAPGGTGLIDSLVIKFTSMDQYN